MERHKATVGPLVVLLMDLTDTKVTDAGVRELQKVLPKTSILREIFRKG